MAKQVEKISKIKKFKKLFSDFYAKFQPKVIYTYEFLFVVLLYGSLLNYTLSILTNYTFNIKLLLALGIAFYFVKEELPRIISKCFPPRII